MSKEKSGGLRAAQFLFGILLTGFSVYGWKDLGMDGLLMFFLGASGISICAYALDLDWW